MPAVIGRFAPSPTGPLHFGSVVAAVASFLEARSRAGRWLVRIDDLDPPREEAGASAMILETLEALGLIWDGDVVFQSTRSDAYDAALDTLARADLTFPCACTRRQIGARPYPGTCRRGLAAGATGRSIRVQVSANAITVDDGVQGLFTQSLASVCGDFIVRRGDGYYAYHLAAVVDDAWQGITEIVRGADLLGSTPQQMHLQALLGLPTPRYAHVPVVLRADGKKLSKQNLALPVQPQDAQHAVFHALRFLGLDIPDEAQLSAPDELLAWALPRWDLSALDPRSSAYAYPQLRA